MFEYDVSFFAQITTFMIFGLFLINYEMYKFNNNLILSTSVN